MPAKIIATDPNSESIAAETAKQIERIKSADALIRVAVVAPGYYAGVYLREAVSAHFKVGLFNVQFMRMGDLAERIAGKKMRDTGRPLLRQVQGIELARITDSRSGRGLSRQGRRVYRSLYTVYQELEMLPRNKVDILPDTDERDRYLLSRFAEYRKSAEQFHTEADTLRLAAELIGSNSDGYSKEVGVVIALAVGHPPPRDIPFWRAIANSPDAVIIVAGEKKEMEPPHPLAFLRSGPVGNKLRSEVQVIQKTETRLFAALSRSDEVRAVIRNIVQLARGGSRFSKMAILYDKPIYAGHIAEALEATGIGCYVPIHYPVAKRPEGQFVQKVVEMVEADFSMLTFVEWLSSAPVRRPGRNKGGDSATPASRWRRLARGMLKRSLWDKEWEGQIEKVSDTEQQHEVAAMAAFARSVRRALAFPRERTYSAWADWLKKFCNRYMETKLIEDAERLFQLLEAIGDLDQLTEGSTVTFDLFKETLIEEMEFLTTATRTNLNRGGVFVAPVWNAAGCVFDAVHIVGMTDGAFPGRPGRKTFLDDAVRRRLDPQGESLMTSEQEAKMERGRFLAALNTAPRRFLYWNVSGGEDGAREIPPSPWFVEQARLAASNQQLQVRDMLEFSKPVELVSNIPEPSKISEATDLAEFDTASAAAHVAMNPQDPQAGRRHTLSTEVPNVGRALEMLQAREGKSFTGFDGNVGSKVATLIKKARPMSATEIEDYASCPFRYFLGRILQLPDSDDSEERHTISPVDRGTLVHRILQEFVNERMETEGMSNTSQISLMRETAERNFRNIERTGYVGLPALWEMEKVSLTQALNRWLEEDRRHREQGWKTLETEMEFGTSEDANPALEIALDRGEVVRVRGVVDRVDVSKEGDRYLVFDYKTGRAKIDKKDPLKKGESMQLGLYAYAVCKLNDVEFENVAAYYWLVNYSHMGKPEFYEEKLKLGERTLKAGTGVILGDDVLEGLTQNLKVISHGIANGVFPARPGNYCENCRYCPFQRICPSSEYQRKITWMRKKDDDQLSGYAVMKNESDKTLEKKAGGDENGYSSAPAYQ